ncbi:MAG: threonyl-tRNA synthetase [Patescibacteria group bacterium]|nr:threonyl-tRNA synthetase [Patescibacteria group bacterium]
MSDNQKNLECTRHTLAHLLASSVQKLYADTNLTLGPAIDNGFYYDIEFKNKKPGTEEELKQLTDKMREYIKIGGEFTHQEATEQEARDIFKDNKFKLELIDEIVKRGEKITLYTINFKNGEKFLDLCRGGHVEHIEDIDEFSFEISKIAGAYWKGDEKREQLTRIYGLAFENQEALNNYKGQQEEAKKRDHRILGRELGLFVFSDLVGPGLPLWTPKGTFIRNKIDNFVQELRSKDGYDRVTIPHITKSDLYKKSGHWEKYAEDLYKINTRDDHVLCMKPMNCPHHAQIYASELRSYKELPVRYSETTMVYRDEQSGELSGLSRVLSITQDDAHIFCRESQLMDEMEKVWNLIEEFYTTFGFLDITPRFSARDDDAKFKGNMELWEKAEAAILQLLNKKVGDKWINGEGEAAFYGPKIDFMAKDALGRTHQVGTIQVDFVQPTNFGLEYVTEEGKRDMPVMIHCAIAGSLERFLSVYLEHTAGNFPLWISPVQVNIIPINNEAHGEYAKDLLNALKENNIRVNILDYKDGLGKKIQKTKEQKIPYHIIIGDKDRDANLYTLESRDLGQIGQVDKLTLINRLKKEIEDKK